MADSINLIFTAGALLWSMAIIFQPNYVDAPMMILSIVPLSFFVFKVAKMVYLYHRRVKSSAAQTLASTVAGLALMHTIAKAMLYGLIDKHLPFFRTPKKAAANKFWHALQSAREEGLFAIALLLAAYGLYKQPIPATSDHLIWIVVLLVQSTPYLAAVILSFMSACAQCSEKLVESISAPITDPSGDEAE
jgi:hypothetical protein